MRILHITPWFPTEENPIHAIFIQRHIQALSPHCDQLVLHIDLNFESLPSHRSETKGVIRIVRSVPFHSWRLREWIFYRLLKKELKRLNASKVFTHVNFYIAYPALIHYKRLAKWLPVKRLITEQWSIYHYNFSMEKPHRRLRDMFHHQIPLAVVSSRLGDDISTFAGIRPDIKVIPNVIDTNVFQFQNLERGEHFLTASLWKSPKTPLVILNTLLQLKEKGIHLKLRMGGYGPDEKEILTFIQENKMEDMVQYIGRIKPADLAMELNKARGFVLATEYETFSAIIAEALGCGCPVIASHSGAIPDLINENNGILVTDDWVNSWMKFLHTTYDSEAIANNAQQRFGIESVGKKYFQLIHDL